MVTRGIDGADIKVTPLNTILIQVGLSLLVAVTTALLTVWLSLRRFYREKWWEAKMTAYTDLIQALHHMKRGIELNMGDLLRGEIEEEEYRKEWSAKNQAAWDEVRKQIDVGEFLYSPTSVAILRTLLKDSHSEVDSFVSYLHTLSAAVDNCISAIKVSARADLGLPPIKGRKSN